LLHVIQGLILWRQNANARPIKYAANRPEANSKWYSRSMGLLGTLILLFLVVHLYHFWTPSRFGGLGSIEPLQEATLTEYNNQYVHNLYAAMQDVFKGNLVVVIIYVLGVTSLFWHLLHGFQSAFQTFGLNHKKYTPLIQGVGFLYSLVICLLFAAMPIAFYLNWIE
jgi:succinate dehydrogenase / fumarate reductase cytochrome b subunit